MDNHVLAQQVRQCQYTSGRLARSVTDAVCGDDIIDSDIACSCCGEQQVTPLQLEAAQGQVMKVSIKAAAHELGVREETLRRWELAGKITAERTVGGHRRYDLSHLRAEAQGREYQQTGPASASRVTIG